MKLACLFDIPEFKKKSLRLLLELLLLQKKKSNPTLNDVGGLQHPALNTPRATALAASDECISMNRAK